jgi:hypothetical protein
MRRYNFTGFVMRRISMSIVALAVLTALAAPAFAEQSPQRLACKSYAREVADQWSEGYIAVADEGTTAAADQVLIIAAGREYYVPRRGSGVIDSVYTRIRKRNQVFWDAFHRCQRDGDIAIKLAPAIETEN